MENTNKKALSLIDQIKHLKVNKNVIFNDISEEDAMTFLLENNYINVISPFKYKFFKVDKDTNPIKENGNHIYPKSIDFNEYKKLYQNERDKYSSIFNKIMKFETIFNSIISYYCLFNLEINRYDIDNAKDYFINSLNNSKYYSNKENLKESIINTIELIFNQDRFKKIRIIIYFLIDYLLVKVELFLYAFQVKLKL